MPASFVNISAYKFVNLDELERWRERILGRADQLRLKGTVLLAPEGINLFVAGTAADIGNFAEFLQSHPEFENLPIKESPSDHQPFSRMLVRIKKEIIAFGVDGIDPARRTSPKLDATELRKWLDEGREVTLLDVRNDYEVELGTFESAVPIGVDHFRDFPRAVRQLPDSMKHKPLVMFCTGGIRCEKAGPFMQAEGFEEVYQLDGGILKYFEEVGKSHYAGECFVFDKRVAVDPQLQETATTQCYNCQHPLTAEEQQSEQYNPPHCCPHCFQTSAELARSLAAARTQRIRQQVDPLPGSRPYDNIRPINVPGRFDRFEVLDFLVGLHPHVPRQAWQDKIDSAAICYKDQPLAAGFQVRAGMRLDHLQPGTVEPDVNADIELLWEDESIVVVNKPAPLPMHPCGRYQRNTLGWILEQSYYPIRVRIVHRLDANTSGLVVMAKKRRVASLLQDQFLAGKVSKRYLARVVGQVDWENYECRLPIGRQAGPVGARQIDQQGLPALTRFRRLDSEDESTLVEAEPVTGRTNQIRIHLWSLGYPVLGDPVFLPGGNLGKSQTLGTSDPPLQLHAARLQFTHPESGQELVFEANPPAWA